MCSSYICYTLLLLYSPQIVFILTRGLTLIDVFLNLAGGEASLVMQGRAALHGASGRVCWAASHWQFHLQVNRTCTLQMIITQIIHSMQDQWSRVPMATLWFSLFHVKFEYKQWTEITGGVNRPLLNNLLIKSTLNDWWNNNFSSCCT